MPPEKDDDLKTFQIGLRSGVAGAPKKTLSNETFEISQQEYPNLSAVSRSRATFKKKVGERVASLKQIATSAEPSAEEKEKAEKARKAWEHAMEVISQLSVKD